MESDKRMLNQTTQYVLCTSTLFRYNTRNVYKCTSDGDKKMKITRSSHGRIRNRYEYYIMYSVTDGGKGRGERGRERIRGVCVRRCNYR